MADRLLWSDHLGYRYTSEGNWIFRDLNFEVHSAESVAIRGTSGIGKTTLLEVLGTMRKPREGEVYIDGHDVYNRDLAGRSKLRGRYLGFVFQESLLLPDLSVWENCRLAVTLSQRSWSINRIRERFESLLGEVGLDPGRGADAPSSFSTGERQRLSLVRSIMHNPKLLIADEPTGNLDYETSHDLIELLLTLCDRDGMALLIASHDRELTQAMERILTMEPDELTET